ncbi:restriction endonuclease subunit S [Brevibacillus centrosporus]|uniref:restriction endonuclease subunit S n=1 Tax=Brevibacillus centrosporus TaxID=54910 RepID=UPI003986098B
MNYVPINNVLIDKIAGEWGLKPKDNSGVKVIRTANFTNLGVIDFSNVVLRQVEPKKIKRKKLVSGDVIIEKSGGSPTQPVGRVVYFENPGDSTYLCNNFATVLRPDKSIIYPKYLFYVLFYNHLTRKTIPFQNKTTGIINLKLDDYLNSVIPLPSINDQIRIATILTRVEALIAKRKESIEALEGLLKSTFMEMFGDPLRNERGWETVYIKDLCNKVIDCPHNTPKYSNIFTGFYCIRSSDIQKGYLEFNSTLQVDVATFKQRNVRHIPSYNDIVFTREGGRLGNSARVPQNVNICLGQRIMLFNVDNNIATSEFFWAMLNSNSLQRCINNLASGGAAPRVNIKDVINIKCCLPPLPLQEHFAKIVKKIDSLKERFSQSLAELENLYGSLSQRAFKGEIDLSKVPVIYEWEVEEIGMTGVDDMGLETRVEFTEQDLIELVKKYSGRIFSFEELWKEIGTLPNKKIPMRKEVQDQLIDLLESSNGDFEQVFEILSSQVSRSDSEKQIAFRGKYEN